MVTTYAAVRYNLEITNPGGFTSRSFIRESNTTAVGHQSNNRLRCLDGPRRSKVIIGNLGRARQAFCAGKPPSAAAGSAIQQGFLTKNGCVATANKLEAFGDEEAIHLAIMAIERCASARARCGLPGPGSLSKPGPCR